MTPHPEIFPWFFGLWVILGLSSLWFFNSETNVQAKRRILPFVAFGTGILFLIFVFLMSGNPRQLLIATPFVILISFLNIRMIKFCGSCGKTIYNQMLFAKANFCARCGAKLDDA